MAIDHIDRDMVINEFRNCCVPLSNDILTSQEEKKLAVILASELL